MPRYNLPDGPAEPPGLPARRAALRALDAVLRRGQTLEQAWPAALGGVYTPADQALARAITAEVLRWMRDLDALIDGATTKRLADDAKARAVLRIALVQPLALGTPPHAAIATALPLVAGGPKRLVHGVFGTVMRAHPRLPATPRLPEPAEARWRATWGDAAVEAACATFAGPPPLDLTTKAATVPAWAEAAGGQSLLPGHLRLPRGTAITALPGFEAGDWWVQDVAAGLPARLLGKGPGRVLDLCAAPGGKTMQLAAAGWDVVAVDHNESRLARLRENLARTRLDARVIAADILSWTPDTPADAVLLDAPCSATGIFRRHPDVLHRVTPAMIADAAGLQVRLLTRAADWVRPGGLLVFATCSLEDEEGEAHLKALLATRDDYVVEPIRPDELPLGLMPAATGALRIPPGALAAQGGCDGFFMVRLRRR